ncbi:flagellin [Flavonifractor plautii]|uniref:Flagellin n=1 Tax=Flavonifractor plautii TaxID=292800 RepID=A0A6I2RLU3_FLAPL|nr:flagellin [Flavonifractor plautii]MCB5374747.1 flagellin [Flavonifractor plautii]MSB04485.1 flagellin [Flavonifractor plautii]MSB07364.1 flagellin [Flavonifractor plautii]MSB50077.1 flagellin [Flavonifractor plautii]
MRIQHNIMAMNAYRNYANNTSALSKNLEKLSSGYKINRAGDDAAGLAISEKMRAQITGLDKAQDNAKDGISLVQTAEGALTEVHDMLNRMYELAEQSANGTFEDGTDRKQLQKEVNQLKSEINRIADSANFNGIKLLDGSMSANATTKLTSTATNSKAGVDLNIVADSVYDATGKRTELDFSLSVTTTANSAGVSVDENGTVLITVMGKDADGISAEEIQAMLAKAKAANSKVSEDIMNAVRDATVTGKGIVAPKSATNATKWTDVATVTSATTANKGESLVLQIGDTSDRFNQLRVGIKDCHVDALGLTDMKIGDQDSAAKALDKIKSAINYVSDVRGTLGATQNRLDHTINNLSVMQENIQDAESTIRDTDVADEMMAYTKNNILIQSAQAMLAQANQVPQGVLQLLQ